MAAVAAGARDLEIDRKVAASGPTD